MASYFKAGWYRGSPYHEDKMSKCPSLPDPARAHQVTDLIR
uniref:Uncharacterized protein n=1 Tax=Arundo donax TaxID=35708 RepID=A0A0A9ATM6_ARUDO